MSSGWTSYTAIIEPAGSNYSAYVPDVPGCIATGQTAAEAQENIGLALQDHVRGLEADEQKVPDPRTIAVTVEVLR